MTQQIEPQLTDVRNFRDLGGLPTTDGRSVLAGRLFRSGHLAHASAADAEFLASLELHTIFDFRNAADIALEGPDVALPGVRNVNVPLSDPAHGAEFWTIVRDGNIEELRNILGNGQAAERMHVAYRDIITNRTPEHSRLLHALADDTVPALLHCAAGKDRAGLSIAVILLALGVQQEAIEADYLLSNDPHRRYKVKRGDNAPSKMSDEVRALLSPLFEARAEYLAEAFATITGTWGSTDRYLTEGLHLAPETRERLRERLLG